MPQPPQEVLPDRLAESQETLPTTLVEIGDTQASVVEPPVDSQVPPSQSQSQAETIPGEPTMTMTTPKESIVQTMHPSPMPPPAAPGPNPPQEPGQSSLPLPVPDTRGVLTPTEPEDSQVGDESVSQAGLPNPPSREGYWRPDQHFEFNDRDFKFL